MGTLGDRIGRRRLLMPSTLALISTMFTDARQRGLAITAWSTCMFTGGALGPVLGGVLLTHFWWGSVFLIGAPTMVVLLVIAPLTLPESRNPDAGRLDLTSVALSLAGILPIAYGVKQLGADRADVLPALVAAAVGTFFTVLFVRRQRTLRDPLPAGRLLEAAHTAFTSGLTVVAACGAVLFLASTILCARRFR